MSSQSSTVIVFDFETSGMSPKYGDRPIEVGAVRLVGGEITGRFQSLMNPGFRVSPFIEDFTGIDNDALRRAPGCDDVMSEFADWIGSEPLVAHNAGFDQRFLDAELGRLGRTRNQAIGCSLLLARRLLPDAPNHKLQTLVHYADLPTDGVYHRALADATMTGHLWLRCRQLICHRIGSEDVGFDLMQALTRVPKRKVASFLAQWGGAEL